MILTQAIAGSIANRIRGQKVRVGILGQDDINALIFACIFSTQYWHLPILYITMRFGSATGWTEFLAGITGRYKLNQNEGYNWISKIVKPCNQFTTFLYGCIRSTLWVICLYLGLLACGNPTPWLITAIPMFYICYKLAYLLTPKGKSYLGLAEILWGVTLWSMI